MCCCGISLRTSTYFWTFLHVFLSVVFLLVCGLEHFKYNRPENEQGVLAYVSAPLITQKSDLVMLWSYGLVYFVSGLMIFQGVHKEFPSLIKWTLFLYAIVEFCTIFWLRSLINKKMDSASDEFWDLFIYIFQTSLVAFFLVIHLFTSLFYSINLIIYAYILNESNMVVQKIVYV